VTKQSKCPCGMPTCDCIYHLNKSWIPSEYLEGLLELEETGESNSVVLAQEEEGRRKAESDSPDRILYDDGSFICLSLAMRARLGKEKMQRIARNNAAIHAAKEFKQHQINFNMSFLFEVIAEDEMERLERALELQRKTIARLTDSFAMDEEEILMIVQHRQIEDEEHNKKKRHGTVMEAEKKKNTRVTSYNSAAIDGEKTYLAMEEMEETHGDPDAECICAIGVVGPKKLSLADEAFHEASKNEEEMEKAPTGWIALYGWLAARVALFK